MTLEQRKELIKAMGYNLAQLHGQIEAGNLSAAGVFMLKLTSAVGILAQEVDELLDAAVARLNN